MTMSTILLIAAVASALIGLALLAASRWGRRTRRVGFRQARQLEPTEDMVGTSRDWQRMTAVSEVADTLRRHWRKTRGAVAALGNRLDHLKLRAAQAASNAGRAEMELEAARLSAEGQPPASLTGRLLALFYGLLYAGDLMVIAVAMMVADSEMPVRFALMSSMAIATALFVSGKLAGHFLRAETNGAGHKRRGAALVVLSGVMVLGVSLMLLRLGVSWAWLVLSITPALGAAGLKILGPSVQQLEVERCTRRLEQAQKRHVAAQRQVDRVEGRKNRLDIKSKYVMQRAVDQAVATLVRLGIGEAEGRRWLMAALEDCNTITGAVLYRSEPSSPTTNPGSTPPDDVLTLVGEDTPSGSGSGAAESPEHGDGAAA